MKTKDAIWRRWMTEYLSVLLELRHGKKGRKNSLAVEDVIVKSQEWNRSFWPLGIVEQLIAGRHGVVQGAKFRVRWSHVKRPVQLLYP